MSVNFNIAEASVGFTRSEKSITMSINATKMIRNSFWGGMHLSFGGIRESDHDKDRPTPLPPWAWTPLVGLIAAPVGEVLSLSQIIVGLAGTIIFVLPAFCGHAKSCKYLMTSANTLILGCFMAAVYPVALAWGHTIGLCR